MKIRKFQLPLLLVLFLLVITVYTELYGWKYMDIAPEGAGVAIAVWNDNGGFAYRKLRPPLFS